MKLNTGISDLWFNHDHSAYAPREVDGEWHDMDLKAMRDEADSFIACLDAAGLAVEFTAADLMADFFRRL